MNFTKAKSGNSTGRSRGIADKRTAPRELLLPHAKNLVERAVSMALAGDTEPLRICIDQLMPMLEQGDPTLYRAVVTDGYDRVALLALLERCSKASTLR